MNKLIRNAIYPADKEYETKPEDFGSEYSSVTFSAKDGTKLCGWWLPKKLGRATVVFCHANGENIGDWAELGQLLDFMQSNIFLFDYRGYGHSEGEPSENGISLDTQAAFDQAIELQQNQSLPIIAIGRSLGGAVAIEMARMRQVAGLVVESSFTRLSDVAGTFSGLNLLPRSMLQWILKAESYNSASKVRTLEIPKLFAHSRSDELIPYSLGEALFQEAASPKMFCNLRGGHNSVKFEQKNYQEAILALMDAAIERSHDNAVRG